MENTENLIILRKIDYKDNHFIVDFLSPVHGKLSSIIYNAKKIKGKSFFPHQIGEILSVKYQYLIEQDFIKIFDISSTFLKSSNKIDFFYFNSLSFILEITSKCISRGEECFYIHKNICNFILGYSEEKSIQVFLLDFVIQLLNHIGILFDFRCCQSCREKSWQIKKDFKYSIRKRNYYLNISEGHIQCENCVNKGLIIQPSSLKCLCYFTDKRTANELKIQVPILVLLDTFYICLDYLTENLELKLLSTKILSGILNSLRKKE